jgi:hypothetical protein
MKYLYFFTTLVFLFLCDHSIAQDNSRSGSNRLEEFNLPPGAVLHKKTKIYDLSYKLKGGTSDKHYVQSDLKILKNISEEELIATKDKNPKYYQYYITGRDFINSLSQKVKSLYTNDELWYIYVFDQKLKQQLTTIK